tara:strand:- start:336 stop:710 length:375 start_codon:yes stop_codon:yes gene_type:complete
MLLDSCAWIEFFIGSKKGEVVKKLLEDKECFTSVVSISEIINWAVSEGFDYERFVKIVRKLSSVLELNDDILEYSGKFNFERKKEIHNWGMLDSFIYCSAKIYSLQVFTFDHHFTGFENAQVVD